MDNPKLLESRWQAVLDVNAHIPLPISHERRNAASRYILLRRIHNEFEEMPGLSLTLCQAARLFGLPLEVAERVLRRLAEARLLRQNGSGQFSLYPDES
jgi:hypothetical protein